MYSNIIEVKLVIGETSHYIPLKLRKLAGQLHRMKINALPHPTQFSLVRNCVWDTLTIDWLDIELRDEGEVIGLPNTVVVPLCAKYPSPISDAKRLSYKSSSMSRQHLV